MPQPRRWLGRRRATLAEFLQTESTSGVLLLASTVAALVWANAFGSYEEFWRGHLQVGHLDKDLRHWVNDGLMTVFFFVVGLEIKRELVTGELRDRRVAALPIAAAIGGMAGPAAVYLALNAGGPGSSGWGIPMATDIAFVAGLLALIGARAPRGLRILLLTLAIVDDIGAIVVIAIFYSAGTQWLWLSMAAGAIGLVLVLRATKVGAVWAYVLPAVVVWLAILESGVHPTIAGVALGLLTPAGAVGGRAVLIELERRFHPVSSYLVVPVFALANAGADLGVDSVRDGLSSRVFWGVAAGLFAGKVAGILASSAASRKIGLGRLPAGVRTGHLIGGAALAGVGFTVSLFIAGLAFESERLVAQAKLGVLGGSVVSAAAGVAVLGLLRPRVARSRRGRRRRRV